MQWTLLAISNYIIVKYKIDYLFFPVQCHVIFIGKSMIYGSSDTFLRYPYDEITPPPFPGEHTPWFENRWTLLICVYYKLS